MNRKLLLTISYLCIFVFACNYSGRLKEGEKIISKIEKFKSEKDRLPISLSEIGIVEKESGPIYYEKKSDTKYIIWFGKELGESVTYDSDTKHWK